MEASSDTVFVRRLREMLPDGVLRRNLGLALEGKDMVSMGPDGLTRPIVREAEWAAGVMVVNHGYGRGMAVRLAQAVQGLRREQDAR